MFSAWFWDGLIDLGMVWGWVGSGWGWFGMVWGWFGAGLGLVWGWFGGVVGGQWGGEIRVTIRAWLQSHWPVGMVEESSNSSYDGFLSGSVA